MAMNEQKAIEGRQKIDEMKDDFIIILFLLALLSLYRIMYVWIRIKEKEWRKLLPILFYFNVL
jgi:hypothetical protein